MRGTTVRVYSTETIKFYDRDSARECTDAVERFAKRYGITEIEIKVAYQPGAAEVVLTCPTIRYEFELSRLSGFCYGFRGSLNKSE